jgi:hypothetical protein
MTGGGTEIKMSGHNGKAKCILEYSKIACLTPSAAQVPLS